MIYINLLCKKVDSETTNINEFIRNNDCNQDTFKFNVKSLPFL